MKNVSAVILISVGLLASGAVSASEELAKSKNCLTCHGVEQKVLGPGFKEVAQKYAGQPDAVAKLAEKILKGGSGAWGQIPMPPNPKVSPEEANKLVEWILGLK